MRTRLIGTLVAIAACGHAWPEHKVLLDFGSADKRKVWVQASMPKGRPDAAQTVEGDKFDWSIGEAPEGAIIFVLHEATGNLCARPLAEAVKNGKIEPQDYGLIMQVSIRLEHQGKPVEAATVTLTDSKRSQTQVLDSSARGKLDFWAVAPGTLKVKVLYRSQGEMAEPLHTSFEAPLRRSKVVPEFAVSILDPVATLEPAESRSATTANEKPVAAPKETGGPMGTLAAILITLVVAGGIGYGALLWLKNNPNQVQAFLKRMGVSVPEPPESTDSAGTPVPASAPVPPQRIILEDADANVQAPTPSAAVASRPRLVRANGHPIELPEGSVTIGRDDGLPISLSGENTLSRRHAEIVRTGEIVALKDLGSTNGTFVNGVQVQGEVVLKPGDQVQFGAVRFRFEV